MTIARVATLSIVALLAVASLAAAVRVTPSLAPGSSDPTQDGTVGQTIYKGMQDPRYAARVQHFLAEHGADHPQKRDLHGMTPLDAAREIVNSEQRAGRTPAEWLRLAKAANLLALQPRAAAGNADLVADITHLDAAAGAPLSASQRAQLARDVAALQPDVRAAFAPLVHAVAVAYDAQAPIAKRQMDKALAGGNAFDLSLSDADREASLANALDLVAAGNAFRDAARTITFPTTSGPVFRDPTGLVILGSTGNDHYARDSALTDPILTVDPLGDDTYDESAGGACADAFHIIFDCNGLSAAFALDLAGNDAYNYAGTPMSVQGSGAFGAIGLLVDATGDDHYQADFVRGARGSLGGQFYLDLNGQGNGFAAVGLLVDGTGNDEYVVSVTDARGDSGIWDESQGFALAGGVGILADGAGDNDFLNYGYNGGCNGCFQGLYPGGTGFYGGTGILSSTGLGNSDYYGYDNATSTDYYGWAFGAFGGTGIFYDDGGNDDYVAYQDSTRNVVEIPLLNCAYGTGSFAGLGVFIDAGGNDRYFSDTKADTSVFTQSEGFGGPTEGEGLFVDASGDDGHFMQAHPHNGANAPEFTTGRGITFHGGEGLTGNTAGVYLDLGGADAYSGASPSADNKYWGLGADINTDGSVPILDPFGGL